jgi:hypothetical protein
MRCTTADLALETLSAAGARFDNSRLGAHDDKMSALNLVR